LSTGAAARIAGCHPITVLRTIERGELPAVRLGEHGHYRIAREDFQSWLRPTTEETR
jgi:excisionase family DNA binding protein